MATIYEFVSDDWTDQNWYEEPQPGTVEELAPYWDEFIRDTITSGREIPDGLTLEGYVSIWNELCKAHA